jgi:hypothetical protein
VGSDAGHQQFAFRLGEVHTTPRFTSPLRSWRQGRRVRQTGSGGAGG